MLSQALAEIGVLVDCGTILASPAPRAQQTAAVISRMSGIEITTEIALSEMGELPPLGLKTEEPFDGFVNRVDRLLRELATEHLGETVIAVTHAGFVVASIVARFDVPRPGTGARLEPRHTSVTEWRAEGSRWTLESFNWVRGEAF